MSKYFVSSDIHSAYTPWMKALNEAGFDKNNPDHKIIVCGDLFDRMNETVQVYNFAKEMDEQGRFIYITGNHEWLLKECVNEIRQGFVPERHHFSNGTVKTICQFFWEILHLFELMQLLMLEIQNFLEVLFHVNLQLIML